MGWEYYPIDGIDCDYDRKNYREPYLETETFYRQHSQTNLLNPVIDLNEFRTSFNFFVYKLSKRKGHIARQHIRIKFKFIAAIDVFDYIAYALVLTPKLTSVSSDGRRHFDFIWNF